MISICTFQITDNGDDKDSCNIEHVDLIKQFDKFWKQCENVERLENVKLSLRMGGLVLMGEYAVHHSVIALNLINSDSLGTAALRKITALRMGQVAL